MALTRKLLKGMGLTDEQVDTIIEAHTDTVDGLKADVDKYKADAEKLPGVQKQLDDLKAAGDGGYKEKYDNSVDAYYRLNRYYAWINNLTTVRISMLYCTAEESERITDIQSVLDSYIRENFAKFVTGGRSLDEFDAYQEELKQLGIEELLDIYQRGYEPYIDSVFN